MKETPVADELQRARNVDVLDVCHVLLVRFLVLVALKVLIVKGVPCHLGNGLAAYR